MDRWHVHRHAGRDDGSAIVEFLCLSLVLLVPLVYLVVALSRIQAGAYGAEFAARESSRGAVVSGIQALERGAGVDQAVAAANQRADTVAGLAVEDFGFDADRAATLTLGCDPQPCLAPGSDVVATVEVTVDLPGVPGFVRSWLPLAVTVRSTSASAVDGFASAS